MPAVDLIYPLRNDVWTEGPTTTKSVNETFDITRSPDLNDPHLISLIFKFKITTATAVGAPVNGLANAISKFNLLINNESVINYNSPYPVATQMVKAQNVSALEYMLQRSGGSVVMNPIDMTAATAVYELFMEIPIGYVFGAERCTAQLIIETGMFTKSTSVAWTKNATKTIGSQSCEVWGRYGVAKTTTLYSVWDSEVFAANQVKPVIMYGKPGYSLLGILISDDLGVTEVGKALLQVGDTTPKEDVLLDYLSGNLLNPYLITYAGSDTAINPARYQQVIPGQTYINTFGIAQGQNVAVSVTDNGNAATIYFAGVYSAPIGGGEQGKPMQTYQQVANAAIATVSDQNECGETVVNVPKSPAGNAGLPSRVSGKRAALLTRRGRY